MARTNEEAPIPKGTYDKDFAHALLRGEKRGGVQLVKYGGRVNSVSVFLCLHCGKHFERRLGSISYMTKRDQKGNNKSCGCVRSDVMKYFGKARRQKTVDRWNKELGKTFGCKRLVSTNPNDMSIVVECKLCQKITKLAPPRSHSFFNREKSRDHRCNCQRRGEAYAYPDAYQTLFFRAKQAYGGKLTFQEFVKKTFKDWLAISRSGTDRPYFDTKSMRVLPFHPKTDFIEVEGKKISMKECMAILGLTRQRIHQMKNKGVLKDRLLAKISR